jgi:hypothetical protein
VVEVAAERLDRVLTELFAVVAFCVHRRQQYERLPAHRLFGQLGLP